MIQLTITATSKGYHPSSDWHVFDERKKTFPAIEAAKDWLGNEYGNCKRSKIYQDKDGDAIHCGWIYGYHNSDISHLPVEKWLQQDWVKFQEVSTVDLSKVK